MNLDFHVNFPNVDFQILAFCDCAQCPWRGDPLLGGPGLGGDRVEGRPSLDHQSAPTSDLLDLEDARSLQICWSLGDPAGGGVAP